MKDPTIPRDLIDAEAQKVIRHLVRSGYEAYLVGGCVRDLLVDRRPKDFDVATSATPSEIRDLFRNCRIIGRRFRLAHIVFGKKVIETATFRRSPREDEEPEDGQKPAASPASSKSPTSASSPTGPSSAASQSSDDLYIHRDNVFGTAEEDARRRDFTINGLFYDLSAERVIDYVGGLADLMQRQVRTIGDPNIRFREDPVRMLRAVKFAARLGFDIEDQTYRALIAHCGEVQKSPVPRVLEEIYRLLRGGAAVESLVLLREVGLLPVLLPEIARRLTDRPEEMEPILGLIDELVQAGDVPSNSILLVLLFLPELLPLFDEATRLRDPAGFFEEVTDPLSSRLKVPRREVERAKLLVLAQRRLLQARRRNARLPGSLAHREELPEVLGLHALVHRVRHRAAGVPASQIEAEIASWPFPSHYRLSSEPAPRPPRPHRGSAGGAEPEPSSQAGAPTPAPIPGADDSDGGRSGRRRRRRREEGEPERENGRESRREGSRAAAPPPAGHGDSDDGPALPDEEAALAAFNALLNSRGHDDD